MPRFQLGRVVVTPGTKDIEHDLLRACLRRHAAGDWGEVSAHDRRENEVGLTREARLWSVYAIDPERPVDADDNTLWVITEADRSFTTIMLPDEY